MAKRKYHQKFYTVPYWCGMHPIEHFDGMGGCWGISYGLVFEQGRSYCKGCTFYKPTARRVRGKILAWGPKEDYAIPLARQRSDGWNRRANRLRNECC